MPGLSIKVLQVGNPVVVDEGGNGEGRSLMMVQSKDQGFQVDSVTKVGPAIEEYSSKDIIRQDLCYPRMSKVVSEVEVRTMVVRDNVESGGSEPILGHSDVVTWASENSPMEGVNIDPSPITYSTKRWKKVARNNHR
ncbi:hypothetical protein ACOSQ4_015203 [Xanthoceras sorbifolium]